MMTTLSSVYKLTSKTIPHGHDGHLVVGRAVVGLVLVGQFFRKQQQRQRRHQQQEGAEDEARPPGAHPARTGLRHTGRLAGVHVIRQEQRAHHEAGRRAHRAYAVHDAWTERKQSSKKMEWKK